MTFTTLTAPSTRTVRLASCATRTKAGLVWKADGWTSKTKPSRRWRRYIRNMSRCVNCVTPSTS